MLKDCMEHVRLGKDRLGQWRLHTTPGTASVSDRWYFASTRRARQAGFVLHDTSASFRPAGLARWPPVRKRTDTKNWVTINHGVWIMDSEHILRDRLTELAADKGLPLSRQETTHLENCDLCLNAYVDLIRESKKIQQ